MLPAGVRILVCTSRQDMRKSFDSLTAVARDFMAEEPQSLSAHRLSRQEPLCG